MAERAMFTVGSNFHPFSMEEMLVPFQLYKDAYEKTENAYTDLADKADKFKYLADTLPEGSKAREIYEGYANGLSQQAEDLAHNGLSQANRRALTSYKRRYQGEIGRLDKADTALQEEIKRRQTLDANDSSMLYANDNINIDNFLDGQSPNLYSVSGNDLYKRGLEIGASGSSRMYSDPKVSQVTKYYQDIFNTQGVTPEAIAAFRRDLSTIPEFADAVTSTLKEKGVTDNLTGSNYERAKESVINGIVNGAIYKRNDSIQRDYSVMTATEAAQDARQREQNQISRDNLNLSAASHGFAKNSRGNWVYSPDRDPEIQKVKAMTGNGNTPDGFYQDPRDGKYKKIPPGYKPDASSPTGLTKDDSNTTAGQKEEEKSATLNNSLLGLTKDDLAHNSGFDVSAGNSKYHYRYIGAISSHGGKWYTGALGSDNPGHNGLAALGFASSSNVEDKWGNFSAEEIDGRSTGDRRVRVLSKDELQKIVDDGIEYKTDAHGKLLVDGNNNLIPKLDRNGQPIVKQGSLLSTINSRLSEEHLSMNDPNLDIRVIVVPNEKDSNKNGYLIAVRQ